GVPLFEGRMVDIFDYRAKAYQGGRGRQAVWNELNFGDPAKAVTPQWRIPMESVPDKLGSSWQLPRIGFCDIASPSNSRTLVATLIPGGVLCGHKVPTLSFSPEEIDLSFLWLGIANSFCLDFLARQKVALTMSYTIVDSFPLPRRIEGLPVEGEIIRRAAQLACCGDAFSSLWDTIVKRGDLQCFEPANEPAQRATVRAELDVYVARDFFGLTKDEMRYVLDPSSVLGEQCGIETFGALKRSEIRQQGTFVSYGLIMKAWDELPAPLVRH
ncbi:MAG: hypothetical protein WAT78_13330, partial [Rhizobiaceae bacterium]